MKTKLLVLSAALMLVVSGCNTSNKSEFTPNTSASTTETSSSSSEGSQTVNVTGVSLDKTEVTLTKGESVQLAATVAPENATNKNVTWTATGDGIVSVDNGLVEALKGGISTVTVTTVDGGFTAQCVVTVKEKDPKPEGAVDLEYSEVKNVASHGDDYCYFNDPEGWSKATATINEAYIYEGKMVFDYKYNEASQPDADNWTVQLFRKNTSLTANTTYELSFDLKSDKAGKIKVNAQDVDIVSGNNKVNVTYKEGTIPGSEGVSFIILFPLQTIGDARVEITNISWEAALVAPEGVVVNEADGGYIVAFSPVTGVDTFKAYYVNTNGEDVDNEQVTNGGKLTKVSTLPDGKYKVYVSSIKGEKESVRSTSYGTFTKGEVAPVVPAAGPKTNMEFGEEHEGGTGPYSVPDDRFVYWNDQNWCGSNVGVTEAYTEEETVHATYTILREYEVWNQGYDGCNYCFQLFYKNTSLKAGDYNLSFKLNSLKAGQVEVNGSMKDIVAGDNDIAVTYTDGVGISSFKLVFPSSMGDNTVVVSNIVWTAK